MIIAMCGASGAGKTTTAKIIMNALPNVQVVSTGDIIRRLLIAKGWEQTSNNLQKLNKLLVEEKGDDYVSIIFDQLSSGAQIYVIDSVRRHVDLDCLKRNYKDVLLLAVTCNCDMRYSRLVARKRVADYVDVESFNNIQQLESEWGVDKLICSADHTIVNEDCLDKLDIAATELIYHISAKYF